MTTLERSEVGEIGEAELAPRRHPGASLVWLVPLVAIAIAAWLVYGAIRDRGPIVRVSFESAEGLEPGKTKVKYRDVEIGTVTAVALDDDPSRIVRPAEADKGNLPPLYPPEAERRAQQGTVTLRVHFGPDGLTRRVDVIQSSGYPLLDDAARTALLAWRFRPGRRADGSATDTLDIAIDFRLH